MIRHSELTREQLHALIRNGEVAWGGNLRLKIYGRLHCWSGRRMKKENRVFFKSESDAKQAGFRACRHCVGAGKSAEC